MQTQADKRRGQGRDMGAKMKDSRRARKCESVAKRGTENLNGVSDEWAISHWLLASCCDCVSMVTISIPGINLVMTTISALLTNHLQSQQNYK